MQLGSVAELATTAIALLALLIAGWAARATVQTNSAQQKTLELQRRQFEAYEAEGRRAQASKVTFHLGEYLLSQEAPLYVLNASAPPIYDVMVSGVFRNSPQHLKIVANAYVVVPSTSGPQRLEYFIPNLLHSVDSKLRLWFRDADGRMWFRDSDGSLAELSEDDVALRMRFHQAEDVPVDSY